MSSTVLWSSTRRCSMASSEYLEIREVVRKLAKANDLEYLGLLDRLGISVIRRVEESTGLSMIEKYSTAMNDHL